MKGFSITIGGGKMRLFSKTNRIPLIIFISFAVLITTAQLNLAATFSASLPALITSAGQSPDAFVVKVLFDRAKISNDYDELASADKLKSIKTLVLVLGGSAKGLGAAGIDEDEELARIKSIIDKAREQKIVVIGIHIGGESRRGPLSQKFIEASAPRCDYLLVKEDGNADKYFTNLSTSKKIPLTLVKDSNEIGTVLKSVFGIM